MYIVNTIATLIQLDHSRWNIAAQNANENTTRNSTNHTNFMNSHIQLITKVVIYNLHEPQMREFIELCPYANVCAPSSRM